MHARHQRSHFDAALSAAVQSMARHNGRVLTLMTPTFHQQPIRRLITPPDRLPDSSHWARSVREEPDNEWRKSDQRRRKYM